MSNRGWSIHQRVLYLDATHVMYYSKVPKNFVGGVRHRKFKKVFKFSDSFADRCFYLS